MSLKDAFLRTRQAALDIAVERARPKTWKAGRVTQDGVTTVTTDPVAADTPDGTHAELLAAHGFDPARYRIVGPIRSTRWTAYLPKEYRTNSVEGEPVEDAFTFQAKASRFQVVERAEGELSIDELVQVVNNYQPGGHNTSADGTIPARVIPIGDLQISKLENPTEELLARAITLMGEAAPSGRVPHIHLPILGDCLEGMVSQGGRNRWRTTLTLTEQVRILRRLILKFVEMLAPLCDRLTIVSVPGNHDEASSRDMATRIDDSWAVEALNMVSDALEYNPAFSHVECYVPGPDEQDVVMEVGGTLVAHVHGHTIRPGKHFQWWAGQSFGERDIGQATLLLQGHMHHFQLSENGRRKWICVPALEQTSVWWEHQTGTPGAPGIISFDLLNGRISNLTKHEPGPEMV